MTLVTVEHRGGATILTLNDPARRNVLTADLCEQLSQAVAHAAEREETRVLVIAAQGPAFCAGAHLDDLRGAAQGRTDNVRAVYKSFMDVADFPLPTIALVDGPAVGAGLNLALACDMRIAGPGASFDTRFLKIGLHPGGGHSWLLLRAVGWAQASRMLLLPGAVGAEEALRIGMVQALVPQDALLDKALTLAGASDGVSRELLIATKATLRKAADATHHAMLDHETAEQMHSLGQPPFQAFLEQVQARARRG